jgi:hypothetical protein
MAESDTPHPDLLPSSPNPVEVSSDPSQPALVESAVQTRDEPAARVIDEGAPAWPLAVAIALPVLFFFVLPPLTRAGIWDPYELNVADLARRIAIHLHGATSLALEGADNSLPYLNDLGRPQLPFTSMALGFRVFGLHEWAGRAPLGLWGLAGVLATYGWLSRLVDRRAGAFAAVALTTMPLFFVQARTMLGDIVMMSAFSMAFGGLLVALFDRGDERGSNLAARATWLGIALLGLLAGFYTRGAFLGVAAPALAASLAYGVVVANSGGARRSFDVLGHGVALCCAAAGLFCVYEAADALAAARGGDLSPWLGAMIRPPTKYPTFDFTLDHIGVGLLPWSAFAPFAFGRLFLSPNPSDRRAFVRESETRVALLIGTGVVFVAHGWLAARTDLVAFAGPAVLAAACGVALRDYERGAHASVAVGVGTGVFLGMFHHELHELPEKAFHAFGVLGATFPENFKAHAYVIWTVVLVGFAGLAFLTMVERDSEREPFDPKKYLQVLLALRDAWDGMLALAYFAMVAGASLAGLAVWAGSRFHARWLPSLSSQTHDGVLNAWWMTAFLPLAVIFGAFFWCDVWLWAFGRARPFSKASFTRGFEPFETLGGFLKLDAVWRAIKDVLFGSLIVSDESVAEGIVLTALLILGPLLVLQIPGLVFLGLYMQGMRPLVAAAFALPAGIAFFLAMGVVGDWLRGSRAAFLVASSGVLGAVLCVSFYPALANQLSPKEVFESYQHVRAANEPLALFGVGGRTAAYYAGGQPLILKDANAAYEWLTGDPSGARRFLAVRTEELPRLNRLYREGRGRSGNGTATNLPVLDGRSSQIILVGSSLRPTEKSDNRLDRIVSSAAPHPQKAMSVNLEDKLEVLGFDIADVSGRLVDHLAPGKKYHMRTYFKVLAPLTSEWEMFIHIDGFRRRHNGDHKIAAGKYPMSLWLVDDIVMDDHEFTLEPNFSPGAYSLYFGLFVGETRLKVKSGPADGENRVNGGMLRVQ